MTEAAYTDSSERLFTMADLDREQPRESEWFERAKKYCDDFALRDPECAYAVIALLREAYEAGREDQRDIEDETRPRY